MSRDCKLLPPGLEASEIVVQAVRLRVLQQHGKLRAHLASRRDTIDSGCHSACDSLNPPNHPRRYLSLPTSMS
jgi:hypothetical protein